ncbi:MAG: O-antigen ligase family protein [Candidatus Binatia bacterium]
MRRVLWPVVGSVALAAVSATAGPEMLIATLVALVAVTIVATRPTWGVATLLTLLMVQYGSRRYEREGVAGIISLLPGGAGLLTVNNLLGLFLALLMFYEIYRDNNWSFLRSRPLHLVILITAVLALSDFMSGIDPSQFDQIGLSMSTGQDPIRLLVSRALFLVLFIFFVRRPRDVRLLIAVFVGLAVITAWSGAQASFVGGGRPEIADYRAGGTEVLIQSTQNPNRLALVCTIALVMIWTYAQADVVRRWRLLALAACLLMVLTVFLSASRGGLIGMSVAGLMLFVRVRGGSGGVLYLLAALTIGAVLISEMVPPEAFERLGNLPGLSRDDGMGSAEGEGSLQRRSYTYKLGVELWEKAPIIGVGPGNWPLVRFMNDPLRSAAAPHSSYLQALVEGGVVSLALYLALFAIAVRDLVRCERSPEAMAAAKRDGLDWVVAATRICLITLMVFSLFADLWYLVFAYFLIGLACVLTQRYLPLAGAAPQLQAA